MENNLLELVTRRLGVKRVEMSFLGLGKLEMLKIIKTL